MGKHISDSLYGCRFIMGTDDDQPIVMQIYAGFDSRDCLTVSIDLTDYDEPEYNCSTAAVVNTDDALKMARRHRIDYGELPSFIALCMAPWRRIANAGFHHARSCFKEITEALLDEGCRFTIRRTYGPGERICC